MNYDNSETIATREHDGIRYRARVHLDEFSADMTPDGDYFGYVFSVSRYGCDLLGQAYNTPKTDFGLSSLWARFGDWDEILEALRGDRSECTECGRIIIRHGEVWQAENTWGKDGHVPSETGHVCDYSESGHWPEEYADSDVVDLDWLSRQDHDIVNVVTKQDLEIWGGWGDGAPLHDDGTPYRPCENNLVEWEAWADGDVYYFTVERAVDWSTDDAEHEDETMTTWHELEAVHGFYGDEYVKEAALESLDGYAPETKEA